MAGAANATRCARLIVFVSLITGPAWALEVSDQQEAQLHALFDQWDSDQTPGCSVAAMHHGRIVHTGTYGMADLDHDVEIEPDTVFFAGSLSKQFTAAAVLLLVQDGKLSLDDYVRSYVRELPDFEHKITVRHLIHHVSGLPDERKLLHLNGWRFTLDRIFQSDSLYVLGLQKRLLFEPGTQHLYSNTGYMLLAEIVARVSDKSFREFTSQRLFKPLGMDRTFFRDDFLEVVPGKAHGYSRQKSTFRLFVTNYDTVGSTGLLTTTSDLLKWQLNFEEQKVGGDNFSAQLITPGRLKDGQTLDYAFGLNHTNYRGQNVIAHAGGDAGYRAYLARFPAHRFNIAILCNTILDPASKAYQIADLLIPDKLDPKPLDANTAASDSEFEIGQGDLDKKEGRFWDETSLSFVRFSVRDGKLFYEYGGTPWELIPLSKTRFRFAWGPIVEFSPDNQMVTEFWGTPNEKTYTRIEPYAPEVSDLKEFTGQYTTDELIVSYRIKLDGQILTVNWMKHVNKRLSPLKPDVFSSPSVGIVTFTRRQDGAVNGLSIRSTGISLSFLKVSD